MEQLTGLDASFMMLESHRTPMHIGSLNIYSQATAPEGRVTFKAILGMIEDRLHLAAPFRQRAVRVPLALDHPWWINDPEFDLEYHVRHIALPAPGDWRQLCIQMARLHSRPLDFDRPLWEFTVIGGLDNIDGVPEGSFAIATKVHHSAIDGVSGTEITAAIHDLSPEIVEHTPAKRWIPEPIPTQAELLVRAGLNNVRHPFRLPKLVADTVPTLVRKRDDFPNLPGSVPRTRFNGRVSPHRVFEARTVPLDDVKAIKNAVDGATVNDVMLALCGGALRRYLSGHDELPENSLIAMAPMSTRSAKDMGAGGNQLTNMAVSMRTDIADPLERLAAVHETSAEAKELANAIGADLLSDATDVLPSVALAMASRLYGRLGNRLSPVFNCVVTNVPGPQFPLFSTGAELVSYYGAGPIADGLGLFIAILSYNGRCTISVTSCRDMMPDPDVFAAAIDDTFAEMLAAAVPATAPKKKPAAKKPSAKKKTAAKKPAAKKPPAKKKTAAKKPPAKKQPADRKAASSS